MNRKPFVASLAVLAVGALAGCATCGGTSCNPGCGAECAPTFETVRESYSVTNPPAGSTRVTPPGSTGQVETSPSGHQDAPAPPTSLKDAYHNAGEMPPTPGPGSTPPSRPQDPPSWPSY